MRNQFEGFTKTVKAFHHMNGQQVIEIEGSMATDTHYRRAALITEENGKTYITDNYIRYVDTLVKEEGTWKISIRDQYFVIVEKKRNESMKKDIFTRLRNGEAIDMQTDEDYKGTAWNEVERTMNLCWKANSVPPFDPIVRQSLDELFQEILSASSTILPPFQLDFACQMEIGEGCFINHGLTVVTTGGVTIEDGVMIGPDASILTVNHDFENTWIIKCKPVRIKKKAWIEPKPLSCQASP